MNQKEKEYLAKANDLIKEFLENVDELSKESKTECSYIDLWISIPIERTLMHNKSYFTKCSNLH